MNTKLSFAEDFTQIFQVLGLYYYFLKFLAFNAWIFRLHFWEKEVFKEIEGFL